MYRADKINLLLPLLLELLLWTPKISRIPEINLFNCNQDSGRENISLNELLESYYLHIYSNREYSTTTGRVKPGAIFKNHQNVFKIEKRKQFHRKNTNYINTCIAM